MSVDLPAPFSPQIAWISPRRTDRLTSCSALTPGKVLVIPRIRRMSSVMTSAQLRLGVVAGVDEFLLVVGLVDDQRLEQVRRDDLVAVVVVLGVVDLGLAALEHGV